MPTEAEGPTGTVALSSTNYVVTVEPDPLVGCLGGRTELEIRVSPIPEIGGAVNVYHNASFVGTTALDGSGSAVAHIDYVELDTNTFRVDFIPAGTTDVAGTTSTTAEGRYYCADVEFSADRGTAVSGETLVRLTAYFSGSWDAAGSVTFIEEFNGTRTLGTAPLGYVDEQHLAALGVRLVGVGTHVVRAMYSGDDMYGSGGSQTVTIEVTGDTGVAASGVGLNFGTFYPYKDKYRDTVSIRGTLLEPASVTIGIYASNGRKVRSLSVTSRAGGYAVAWNGRYASGTRVAAGKYRVVQTIRDFSGHTKAFTSYTSVSNKRLHWHTGTQTKYGAQTSTYDYSNYGWVRSSYKYSRGVNLYGNIYDEYAYTGYNFTLPSATVYGTLTFKVLGTPQSGYGVPYISFWNYANQSEDGDRSVGRSYAWYSTSVSGAGHVSARHVRGYVTVLGENRGFYDVAKVQLTYKYATLG